MDSLFHHYSVHLCNSVSTQEICIYAAEYYKLFRSYSKVNSHQFLFTLLSEQKPYSCSYIQIHKNKNI